MSLKAGVGLLVVVDVPASRSVILHTFAVIYDFVSDAISKRDMCGVTVVCIITV